MGGLLGGGGGGAKGYVGPPSQIIVGLPPSSYAYVITGPCCIARNSNKTYVQHIQSEKKGIFFFVQTD